MFKKNLTRLEQLVYNEGERLIPYITHDENEVIRHRSSYAFFKKIIEYDIIERNNDTKLLSIVDLGSGCGFGCAILSNINNSKILGVDICQECLDYSQLFYGRDNVEYRLEDLSQYIPVMETFDYVTSRGVLEHVADGIELIKSVPFNKRFIFNIPYDEKEGNEFHVLTGITEEDFMALEGCEFFYEDLDGVIYEHRSRPEKVNMIACVVSSPELPKVETLFAFPLPPSTDRELEAAKPENVRKNRSFFYDNATELLLKVEHLVKETEVVMDVGCGIRPMTYFRPKLHIMVEPCKEYSEILQYRNNGYKGEIVVNSDAKTLLEFMSENSVDSIFLLDVLEHMDKEIGLDVIKHCERVAREQVVIFTPLGFMPQHLDCDEKDSWGLNGSVMQNHISGWGPKDFGFGWDFHICRQFHEINHKSEVLENPFGAFYGILNLNDKKNIIPEIMPKLEFNHPFEQELEQVNYELTMARQSLIEVNSELVSLRNSKPVVYAQQIKRILKAFGLR